jgi:hypothetical protein
MYFSNELAFLVLEYNMTTIDYIKNEVIILHLISKFIIYIYIYSLYIKSPGLPIIKEAQASQHGHFG